MKDWKIILIITISVIALFTLLILSISFFCFLKIFYSPRKNKIKEEYPIPKGRAYEKHREQLTNWIKEVRSIPHKDIEITSFDGLKLRGKYFEYDKNAPTELLFHGYRGDSERDLSAGVIRCFELKHNAVLIDHRGSGRSEGNIITFGIKETQDCIDWINYYIDNINKSSKIILTGISMGAATVMMASNKDLPNNVIGVLADCGYTSAQEIIKTVMKKMKLPASLLYPFVYLGAKIFGHFNIEEDSPIKAVQKAKIPIIFIHGSKDSFVPHYMSVNNFNACISKKELVTIDGAQHGLAYVIDSKKYLKALEDFFHL